ncbi:MAG: lytic transglycosylase domain-containing protein [Succinivibrio sp.]|nr:lytic transglycosylase domain-containing protein [Succinivibrio sp.]
MSHSVTVQMLSSLKSPKDSAQSWLKEARKAADASGLPLNLILAVIDTESGAVAQAVSEKGAQGLMQLMPATQLDLGVANPFDPEENIMAGSRYLAWLYQRFNDLELALAAYNAGPGNVAKYGGIPPFAETQNFVRRVIDRYKSLDSRSN